MKHKNLFIGQSSVVIFLILLSFIIAGGIIFKLNSQITKQANKEEIVTISSTTENTTIPVEIKEKIIEDLSSIDKVVMLDRCYFDILPSKYTGKFLCGITVSKDNKKIIYIDYDFQKGKVVKTKIVFRNLENDIKKEKELSKKGLYPPNWILNAPFVFDPTSHKVAIHLIDYGNQESQLFLLFYTDTGETKELGALAGFLENGDFVYIQEGQEEGSLVLNIEDRKIKLPIKITLPDIVDNSVESPLDVYIYDNFIICETNISSSTETTKSVYVFNREGKLLYQKVITKPIKYNIYGKRKLFYFWPREYKYQTNQLLYVLDYDGKKSLYLNDKEIIPPGQYDEIYSAFFDKDDNLWVRARIEEKNTSFHLVTKNGKVIYKSEYEGNLSNDKGVVVYRGVEKINNKEYESIYINNKKIFSQEGKCLAKKLNCSNCCDLALDLSPDNKNIAFLIEDKNKKYQLMINQTEAKNSGFEDIISGPVWLNNENVLLIEGLDKIEFLQECCSVSVFYHKKKIYIFDKKGNLVWLSPEFDDVFGTPQIISDKLIFIAQEGKKLVLKVEDIGK